MIEQTRLSLELELWDHQKQYLTVAEMLQWGAIGYKNMLRKKTDVELWNLHAETFNFGKD